MNKTRTKEFTNIDQKVQEAQIKLLYKQTWTGLTGVLIVALMACVIFWQIIPQQKLLLWGGLSVLLTLIRGSIIFNFHKKVSISDKLNRWAKLHVFGTTASALLWAAPSIFLWPEDYSVFQLVWPILILPLSAAAVATYYTWNSSYISFLVITTIPLSLRFFWEGGFLFNIMGFLSLFFIAVLLRAGKVMHSASVRSFEFGIRNETLNLKLNNEITGREELNLQLQKEIIERILSEEKLSKKNQDLILLNDELRSTKSNLETSNKKVKDAIESINELSGLLPICASCKKIRDDKGYWNQIETYIRERSDAEFSHGICPDCAKEMYPKFNLNKNKEDL